MASERYFHVAFTTDNTRGAIQFKTDNYQYVNLKVLTKHIETDFFKHGMQGMLVITNILELDKSDYMDFMR